ncbi:MAG: dicarboxylate/amino acid:cation symporter [Myxococcota bacterium]
MAGNDADSGGRDGGTRKSLAVHWQIMIGLGAGLVAGVVLNLAKGSIYELVGPDGFDRTAVDFVVNLNAFVGDLFLRALRFIAVPIVLFSLIEGAASLNDLRKLSRIGGKTVGIYLVTTAVAISVGILLAKLLQPGKYVPDDVREGLSAAGGGDAAAKIEAAKAPSAWETALDIVPTNPFASLADGSMLQVVFFALAIGIGLTLIPERKSRPVIQLANALTDVIIKLVHVIMRVAPYAVFALLVKVVADLGLDVLGSLVVYSGTVVGGLAVMMFGVYPAILKLATRVGYRRFFRAIAPAQLLGFSSSSSSATLPVTMECVEERLGVSEDVTSFAVPLGATINMDGTALYQGVAALFITQLYGMDLDLAQQATIVLTATLASIGTAGVPGVGIIMLVIVLQTLGLSPSMMEEGIAIIFGVDRLLDMCRTSCNVTGDCMVASVVASSEDEILSEEEVARRLEARRASDFDEHPLGPDDRPEFRPEAGDQREE